MPLHAWTSARYTIPLPAGHRFPMAKYAMLRDRVASEELVPADTLHEPQRARRDNLLLVDDVAYVEAMEHGTLGAAEMRRIGFPWSAALMERSVRSAGGTCEAAAAVLAACREIGLPVCVTIAGGYGVNIADTFEVHSNTVRIAASFAAN